MKKFMVVTALVFGLAACTSYTQTTSGKDYLKNHASLQNSGNSPEFQKALQAAASVEPTLTFPARIGLAKIYQGKLVTLSGTEMAGWQNMQKDIEAEAGKNFGELIPVNPMVAHSVTRAFEADDGNAVNGIRLGAARQHLDAVLIYEVYSNSRSEGNFASFVSTLSVIGAYILPTDEVNAEGYASALLIDVMHGYPYGNIAATVEKDQLHSAAFRARKDERKLKDKVESRVAEKLMAEAKPMFIKLMAQLHK